MIESWKKAVEGGYDDLIMQFIALLFMAIMLNGWAVFSYKKNS
jgi:ABC-2 type transport system permease protein